MIDALCHTDDPIETRTSGQNDSTLMVTLLVVGRMLHTAVV